MVQRCWVNFQCWGVLLIRIIVGQGPIALAIGADGGCLDIFSLIYHFSFLSPSLWEAARYRLKYCLKGPLNAEQPTNQPILYFNDTQHLKSPMNQKQKSRLGTANNKITRARTSLFLGVNRFQLSTTITYYDTTELNSSILPGNKHYKYHGTLKSA